MKKSVKNLGNVIEICVAMIIANFVMLGVLWLFASTLRGNIGPLGLIVLALSLFIFFFIPIYVRTRMIGIAEMVDSYFDRKIAKEKREIQERVKKARRDIRYLYRITEVKPDSQRPFTFLVWFKEDMVNQYLPVVKVEGEVIGFEIVDNCSVRFNLSSILSTRLDSLTFSTEAGVEVVLNPYFLKDVGTEIPWQCKGHADERVILIPMSYFPNADEDAVYEFKMKTGRRNIGTFKGKLDSDMGVIVVMLGGEFNSKKCENKKVSIKLNIPGSSILELPKPTVFSVNHQRVV